LQALAPEVADKEPQEMIRMHGYFQSSSSYRCRIAFGLKGVNYDLRAVHLVRNGGAQKTDAYRALNPQALVPAVEVDGHVLTQSPAILEWLEETYPEPPLLPSDRIDRAHVRAFCAAIACEIHPLQNLRVVEYLRAEFGADKTGVDAWFHHWIGEGLAACEALLHGRPTTPFAFGDTPGLAEIYLIPQLYHAARRGVDISDLKRLSAIGDACAQLPAFVEAHPSKQPDAE